ncbi:hypothetical protein [Nonomuraea typhae]|uniref:hypothetical protein n=1 Tax=Nonomuraea typhae TaxID=2603600 RepID=UPI0012FAA22F|nr:hypothetical protein [Nonomuraea typhae]
MGIVNTARRRTAGGRDAGTVSGAARRWVMGGWEAGTVGGAARRWAVGAVGAAGRWAVAAAGGWAAGAAGAAARCWAVEAARAAAEVPAVGAEAAAWTVYGWAEVALACAVLGEPAAFAGLDEVVAAGAVRHGGPAAERLSALRAMAGPVPGFYPDAGPPGPVPPVGEDTWRACAALAAFCDALPSGCAAAGGFSWSRDGFVPVPDRARAQLRWGERYRPSARRGHRVVAGERFAGLVRRTWIRLPGHPAVLVDVPRQGPEPVRRVWRGIHDGAHLDHLALAGEGPVEFGHGLLAAESYAMAVELVALLESLERGDVQVAACLRDGLAERIGRLPGFPGPLRQAGRTVRRAAGHRSPDLAHLPRLAATYVTGPLRLLAGHGPASAGHGPSPVGDGHALPARLWRDLLGRWSALTRRWPAAQRLMADVADIHADEVSMASPGFVVQWPSAIRDEKL